MILPTAVLLGPNGLLQGNSDSRLCSRRVWLQGNQLYPSSLNIYWPFPKLVFTLYSSTWVPVSVPPRCKKLNYADFGRADPFDPNPHEQVYASLSFSLTSHIMKRYEWKCCACSGIPLTCPLCSRREFGILLTSSQQRVRTVHSRRILELL